MSQGITKHKPIDQSSIKAKIVLTQSRIQQSFKDPLKYISSFLIALVYIQCLKYPIDLYSKQWFAQDRVIFSYIDVSYYSGNVPALLSFTIAIVYFIFNVVLVVFEKKLKKHAPFMAAKLIQMFFSSVLFMWVIGNACTIISQYFLHHNTTLFAVILAFISLFLFSFTILLQTFIRFDFLVVCTSSGVVRTSNWSGAVLLAYILINQLISKLTNTQTSIHLITMSLSMAFVVFIFFIKNQHEEEIPFRIQLSAMSINILCIAMLACIKLLNISLGIELLVILSIILCFSIWQLHYFNITFELENVNKWSNSQIMMSYASKLRKVLINFHEYYHNTLFLGYIEIHQQKCDNEACPLRVLPVDDNKKQDRFEDIIRKIYNDGCKLTPVNPQLQLEYAIFHYETGAKEKSMKMLLQLKWNDLPLDKYYKFSRLKNLIHRQISQLPHQEFLDLLSQIKVKDLEQKIIKKFEEAALINLQFWSVLNEDHPDFRKLHQVGKSRVIIGNEVNVLYKEITQIAHSQRVTNLYIHYLNGIENDEKLFSQIYGNIKNEDGFDQKIVIEDWSNNCSPIMIVSIEEENFGVITDLNTTCATMLGYERFDLLGREIKILFPGCLATQMQTFINPKYAKDGEEVFYIGYSNGFAIKATRKMQSYNSIETGLSLIITLQQKFIPNTGFIIFNKQTKIATLSASCLQLLAIEDNVLETDVFYDDLFNTKLKEINQQKTILKLSALLNEPNKNKFQQSYKSINQAADRLFNVYKKDYDHFFVINYIFLKNVKTSPSKLNTQNNQLNVFEFCFQVSYWNEELTFVGGYQNDEMIAKLQQQLSLNSNGDKETGEKKNYAEGITTLRLHQNYIKVIEESEDSSQHGDQKSRAQTNNQLIAKVNHLSKVDEQKIFESRETYYSFIDKNTRKMYLRLGLFISILLTIGVYVGFYFISKSGYHEIYQNYNELILENQIIGQITEAGRVLLQTKYRIKSGDSQMDHMIINSFNQRLQNMQQLVSQYNDPYMLQVMINGNQSQTFRSDEFILAFISQFSKLNNQIKGNSGFNGLILDANSSLYVQLNSNQTKQKMYNQIDVIKQNSRNSGNKAQYINITMNAIGIVFSLVLTFFLIYSIRTFNQYKIQILSIFLETTEKDIQNYSEKTENFLITIHVDESNQNNQNVEEINEGKRGSSAMFAKKKRFKTTNLQKSPYFMLATFFFLTSTYYIHSLVFNYEKLSFLTNAISFIGISSQYRYILSSEQAKIDQKLLENYNYGSKVTDWILTGQVNTNYLEYQRDYFTWHYQTYGVFDDFHQNFTTIFMKDICNGQIKVQYACQSGIMATNGTLLMLTDITVVNQQIDFSRPLPIQYYYSMQTIKQSHSILLDDLVEVNNELFSSILSNILGILIIWMVVVVIVGILIQIYVQQVVVKDTNIIKSMLKFFPVSFARNSQGIRNFVASIIKQQGDIKL